MNLTRPGPIAAHRQRPTCDLTEIGRRTGWTGERILAAIDDGVLPWAWNISAKETGQRCIRVLAVNVDKLASGQDTPLHERMEFDKVLALLLPHSRDTLRTADICWALNCSPDHVLDLVRAKHLAAIGAIKRSSQGAARISRESIISFVKARRVV